MKNSELELIMIESLIKSDKRMMILQSILISDSLIEYIIKYLIFDLVGIGLIIKSNVGSLFNVIIYLRTEDEREIIKCVMIEEFSDKSEKVLMLKRFKGDLYYVQVFIQHTLTKSI